MVKKRDKIKTSRFSDLLAVIVLTMSFIFLFSSITYASLFISNSTNFGNGTYYNTSLNASGFIQIDFTQGVNGSYLSNASDMNAGEIVIWNNISWVQEVNYTAELPNFQATESSPYLVRGMNMTDNVLLMHLNNDSNVGENDTHVFDFSGNNNNGTGLGFNGTEIVSNGKFKGAFDFDGIDDKINITNTVSTSLFSNFTISFWINPTDSGITSRIISKWEAGDQLYTILIGAAADQMTFFFDTSVVATSPNAVNYGVWQMWTAVHNGTDALLYLNGVLDISGGASTVSSQSGNKDLLIGGKLDNAQQYRGLLDELAIWNRTLSNEEILDAYKRGAVRLNLTVRSCNDALCDGESFTDITNISPQDLSEDNNQFFQYNVSFFSDNVTTVTPKLFNVTVDYTGLIPLAIINSPANTTFSTTQIFFNITATGPGIDNCLYSIDNGTTNLTMTNTTSAPTMWNATNSTMSQGSRTANFYCNSTSNIWNNTESVTFFIDSITPNINITFPANNTNSSSTGLNVNYTVSDTNLATCWYSNDSNTVNLSLGSNCANITNITWSDGFHNVTVYVNDSSGNENSSKIFFTVDTIKPNINITFPANNTNSSRTSLDINYTILDANSQACWYSNDSMTKNLSLGSNCANITNITWSDGFHNVTVYVNDSSGNENSSTIFFTIDTINPDINFTTPTPANNTGKSNNFNINISITELNFANVTYDWNGTLTTYDISDPEITNIGGGNYAFNLTQTGLTSGLSYTYNVTVRDSANNVNSTETRTILGNAPPTFISVINTPTTLGDLDPNILVNITVNISDTDNNFDTAILQWKNDTSGWTNLTMNNLTAKGEYTLVNMNITFAIESNYTYRIWANDTEATTNFSSNNSLQIFWDCTWWATSTLGATAGYNINQIIGNISINNTGDSFHANSSCSLDFRINYDLDEGRVYYDEEYVKNVKSYTVAAKANLTIEINATFSTTVKQENVNITIDEYRKRTNQTYKNVTATLVTSQSGPYLFEQLTSSPSSVDLTASNFTLQGFVRNLLGSTTVNITNTAYNISLNWSLPQGIVNSSGPLTIFFTNMSNNSLNYNNINATFSNLASMTSGVKTISLSVSGYNLSGDLIEDAIGSTLLNDSTTITFLCYNISDSVNVSACGSLDGDYVTLTTTTETTTTASGGGGGGSGGGAATENVKTSSDFQLVRGKQNEIKIPFKNRHPNLSLKNLEFTVTGNIAKYIDILPKTLAELRSGAEINIILKITSPSYIDLGRQEITILIKGKKGSIVYSEIKKITLEIHELDNKTAKGLLDESVKLIDQLQKANLSYDYLNDLLNQSVKEMKSFNYEIVLINYEIIEEQVTNAIKTKEIIKEIAELINIAEKKGIDITGSSRLLKLAELSLERREFQQAYKRVKDAQITYALEVKGEFGKISYYLKTYPERSSLAALSFLILSLGTFKISKLQILKKKIKKLKREEIILIQLMAMLQKECFKEKKMSMDEYRIAMEEYQKRLSKVIEQIIALESRRVHALKFTKENKRLRLERQEVIKLIEQLQKEYLKKGIIETKTYELKLKSYNKRITEIDERIASLEAKKAFKGGLKFFNIFKIPKKL